MTGSGSATPDGSTSSTSIECDIGKLLDSKDLHNLSREHKYNILTKEPNPDPSIYPHSRLWVCIFSPVPTSMVKAISHYSKHVDGIFCRASLHQIRLEGKLLV